MANLRYSDKHNMVAFLKKHNESVGFTEIVDFLKGSSLRYALTHNLTIYDSLVKQFWQTATVRILANGIQELVDNKEYTITEASVRTKLQLADATGIHNLPDAEIYSGLATLGGYAREHVPLLPAMLAGAAEDQGEGSAIPTDPHHTPIDPVPSISQPPNLSTTKSQHSPSPKPIKTEGAATTTSSLDAGLDSGQFATKKLMAIVPKLVTRIDSLEKELEETKQTLGNVVLTLVKKGRNIQDIEDDPLVSLVKDYMEEKAADFVTPTKISASGEAQEDDISPTILEEAKTLSHVVSQRARSTDKGKRTLEEQELSEQQKKRKVEVQEAAQRYSEEDWDNIRAKHETNAELVKDVLGENVTSDDFAKRMVEMINQKKKYYSEQKTRARKNKPMTQAQQRYYMSTFIKNQSS
ncbi:hypothetical protein Tco_0401657 [Tanacetum coccineum]